MILFSTFVYFNPCARHVRPGALIYRHGLFIPYGKPTYFRVLIAAWAGKYEYMSLDSQHARKVFCAACSSSPRGYHDIGAACQDRIGPSSAILPAFHHKQTTWTFPFFMAFCCKTSVVLWLRPPAFKSHLQFDCFRCRWSGMHFPVPSGRTYRLPMYQQTS